MGHMHDRTVDVSALVARRAERGWSIVQLAQQSGVSLSLLAKVHQGRRGLGDVSAVKIARALGCRVEDISTPKPRRTPVAGHTRAAA